MELSFHHHLAFDAGVAPKADIHPPPAKRSRLDSERLRLAHRTRRPLCGSVQVRQTDCGGKGLCPT
jgi:hypothetical protein